MDTGRLPARALALAWALAPLSALLALGGRELYVEERVHFWAVIATGLTASAAALALTAAGLRRRDPRALAVGGAFSLMAALLFVHGLATPDVLIGENGLVAFAGGATLPVGAAVLALAAMPPLRRPERLAWLLAGILSALAAILLLSLAGLLVPSLVPAVPVPGSPVALAALALGLALFVTVGVRAVRTYALTRRRADLLVAVGIAWLATALAAAMTETYDRAGFWLGHTFELCGLALVGGAVALDLRRSAPSRPLTGDLCGEELVTREQEYLGSHVRALLVALARKDGSTERHTRAVASLAVRVGEDMGLPAGRLRALAIGALLHDIGKLAVPTSILQKPAALDPAEYAVVKRHPADGDELLTRLGGFSDRVRALVHDHHERLDGSGYPRGLVAAQLDVDTRILAVCDVYDALVSTRVYRQAWSPDAALELLRRESPTAFDARVVAALARVVAAAGTTERLAPEAATREAPRAAAAPPEPLPDAA